MKMYVIVSYFTCIFIIKIVRVLLSFTPKNNELLYMVFRICREDTWFLILIKGAPGKFAEYQGQWMGTSMAVQ